MKNNVEKYVVVDAEGQHLSTPLPLKEATRKMQELSRNLEERKGVIKSPISVKQLLLES